VTSPYQCHFLSSKYQAATLYRSTLDSGLLCFRVIIIKLDELPIFVKEISPLSSLFDLHHWTSLFAAPLVCKLVTPLLFLIVFSSMHCVLSFVHMSASICLSLASVLRWCFSTFGLFLCQSLGLPWLLSDATWCLKSEFLKGQIHGVLFVRAFSWSLCLLQETKTINSY